MAVKAHSRTAGYGWMMWAFWAAGVALLLVELNVGMEYLEAGLQQNMGSLGWAPALGIIRLRLAEQSVWHLGALATAARAVPLGALGLLLVALGLALNKHMSAVPAEKVRE